MTLFAVHEHTLPETGKSALFPVWFGLPAVIEGLVVHGEKDRAASLYPVSLQMIEQGIIVGEWGVFETQVGIAVAAGKRYDHAERHFENALRLAHELPHILAQAEGRRWYAWMLNDRRASGDLHRARVLLLEAKVIYQRMGMPRHLELARQLVWQVEAC